MGIDVASRFDRSADLDDASFRLTGRSGPDGYKKYSNRHGYPDDAQRDIDDIDDVKTVQDCADMCR